MATWLIARNFLRENRWPVLILLAWIIFSTAVTAGFGRERVVPEDVVFFVQQQAVYICAFSAFLAANAIHNERRSRRILLVLSKAVSRGEYLLAMLIGTLTMTASLCGALRGLLQVAGTPRSIADRRSVVGGRVSGGGFGYNGCGRPVLFHVPESVPCDCAHGNHLRRTRTDAPRTSAVVSVDSWLGGAVRCSAFPLSRWMDDGLGRGGDCSARSRGVLGIGGDCFYLPRHRRASRVRSGSPQRHRGTEKFGLGRRDLCAYFSRSCAP